MFLNRSMLESGTIPAGMYRVRCPWCGHHKMHYGEKADLRGQERSDVFSCRGCGSAYDVEDMLEEMEDWTEA